MPEDNLQQNSTANVGQPEKLFAGKYKTIEELERGYLSQMGETNKIINERDTFKTRDEALEPLLTASVADRIHPADRAAARTSVFNDLASGSNVDPNQLVSTITEIVRDAVREEVTPITRNIMARQTVVSENPDFPKFEGEITQFLAANPDLKARVGNMINGGEPAGALDYAYKSWKLSQANTPTPSPPSDSTGQNQLNARLDAMIPSGSARGASELQNEEAKARGDWANWVNFSDQKSFDSWLSYAMKGVVPEWHVAGTAPPPGTTI